MSFNYTTPSRQKELREIRSSSCWDRFLNKTISFDQANVSHYGNKKVRMQESLNSARTIDKSRTYRDEGNYVRPQGLRVNPRRYRKWFN